VLESQRLVTREVLLRALRNQKVVGGKLGTCLLEIDALPEDALLRALALQQGVDAVGADDLRGIGEEVVRLVPAKVARRLVAVPFRGSGTSAHVALLDARDLAALDELAFVSGRRIRPYVATEVRILEALEKHYGFDCPPRISKLLDKLNRQRFLWPAAEPEVETTLAVPDPEVLRWDPRLGGPRDRGDFETHPTLAPEEPARVPTLAVPESEIAAAAAAGAALVSGAATATPAAVSSPAVPPQDAPAVRQAGGPPAPPAPLSFEGAENRLLDPRDRDDVARTLLEFAAVRARRALLFKVQREEVAAWMAEGDLDRARFAAYRVGLGRPSLFALLQGGAPMARGPLAPMPAHAELRAALRGPAASDGLAVPVRLKERLVAVLYAEPASGAFPAEVVQDLQRLAAKAAIAFELCIMRAKLRRA
jgi:hypothetical protein